MKFLRGTLGFMCVGLLVSGVWGLFSSAYGILGGWLAAFFIIAPMWFMNHHMGLIPNEDGAAFVDMGLGVGVACFMKDVFTSGASVGVDALPTLLLVALGATIGGIVVAAVQKDMAPKTEVVISENKEIEN